MRLLLALLLLIPFGLNAATVFTEFYCDSTVGTNINSGSTTNAAAIYTAVNGNWDGTSVYTPTDGSTPASTVSAGMWASIYVDGATNLVQASSGGCIMLITNVAAGVNGAITFQRAAFAGTAPSSSATGRSIKVGGAWNGPYKTIGFPFGFIANTATNSVGIIPRVNFKNSSIYGVTAAIAHGLVGPVRFQGYSTTPGDSGRAIIDAGDPGTSFAILNFNGSASYIDICDLVVRNNGSSSAAMYGFQANATLGVSFLRCIATNISGNGFSLCPYVYECEAVACNKNNAVGIGGFSNCGLLVNCISHDHVGTRGNGFVSTTAGLPTMIRCIAYNNGGDGVYNNGNEFKILSSDFYNNASNGVYAVQTGQSCLIIENCNFVKNGQWGISNVSTANLRVGRIINCGFGSGTAANGSGEIAASGISGIEVPAQITFAANSTPWTDPANGNFTVAGTVSKSMGRSFFLQSSVNSPSNTVSYPDLGAVQSASTNTTESGGGGSYTFAQ